MTRRAQDTDRRPFRFDPDQRGRDFTRKRKRRGRGQQSQTVERRVADLETFSYLSTHVAIQPPANSRIQVVAELPEATPLDIGRQLIVRSPAAVQDVLYVGLQQSDGTVVWVQWTTAYGGGGGAPVDADTVSVSFAKHIALGVSPLACHATANYVYFSYLGGSNLRRYDRSSGAITTLSFPGVLQPRGIYAEDDGKIWVAVDNGAVTPNSGSIRYWNGTSSVTSPNTDISYLGVTFNPISGSLYAGGYLDNLSGKMRRLHKTTLASQALVTSSTRLFGAAVDASGFVYMSVDSSVLKLDSALAFQSSFDGAGSIYGITNGPYGLAFDGDNRLYVAAGGKNRVSVFNTDGEAIGAFGVGGTGAGQLKNPLDVTVHGTTLWVADIDNNRLSEWTINS